MTPTILEDHVQRAMRSFLLAVLPEGIDAIIAQDNRVPEPAASNFVVMTPLRRPRLSTNVQNAADVRFDGSIAGNVMTVTAVSFGSIEVGATVFGSGVELATTITGTLGGTGGVGDYAVTPNQVAPAQVLSAGRISIEQSTEFVFQLDFHGPSSSDNAQVVSTLMRSPYGVDLFAAQDPAVAVPLYADDPVQRPFINEAQAYENRWVLEVHLQYKPIVLVPSQYADTIDVSIISVDATYPPT